MNLIFQAHQRGKPVLWRFSAGWAFLALGVLSLGFSALSVSVGYWYGVNGHSSSASFLDSWNQELALQRKELNIVKSETDASVRALTQRIGQIQAHVTRLDALGQRLVNMAALDNDEFSFDQVPALGGPEMFDGVSSLKVVGLEETISNLASQLDDREQQLVVLEQLILNLNLQAEVLPSGRPVIKGWLSSRYGMRTSPFNGLQQMHKGIDFAGRYGSEIIAVAGGIVTFSGKNGSYGYMLEINHGDNYSTRYAHNDKNLVKEGDAVRKGQVIALMGSTGRSTGPHVHFEVLQSGRQVNPSKFIQKSQ